MTDTALANAYVFPQDAADPADTGDGTGLTGTDGSVESFSSAAYFGLLAQATERDHIPNGLQGSIGAGTEDLTLTAGHAFISEAGNWAQDNTGAYEVQLPSGSDMTYVAVLEASETVTLATDATSELYLAIDPTTPNDVYLRHGTAVSAPTDPYHYLGSADTAAETVNDQATRFPVGTTQLDDDAVTAAKIGAGEVGVSEMDFTTGMTNDSVDQPSQIQQNDPTHSAKNKILVPPAAGVNNFASQEYNHFLLADVLDADTVTDDNGTVTDLPKMLDLEAASSAILASTGDTQLTFQFSTANPNNRPSSPKVIFAIFRSSDPGTPLDQVTVEESSDGVTFNTILSDTTPQQNMSDDDIVYVSPQLSNVGAREYYRVTLGTDGTAQMRIRHLGMLGPNQQNNQRYLVHRTGGPKSAMSGDFHMANNTVRDAEGFEGDEQSVVPAPDNSEGVFWVSSGSIAGTEAAGSPMYSYRDSGGTLTHYEITKTTP